MPRQIALLDANVLYPAPVRDLFMQMAVGGLYQARWTERIQVEWMRSVLANRSERYAAALRRTADLMNAAIPNSIVIDYEHLVETLDLPDPNDRHVLAAAIKAGADVIVTFNLRDFPHGCLATHGLRAQHPDDFLNEQLLHDPPEFLACVKAI